MKCEKSSNCTVALADVKVRQHGFYELNEGLEVRRDFNRTVGKSLANYLSFFVMTKSL